MFCGILESNVMRDGDKARRGRTEYIHTRYSIIAFPMDF